MIKLLITLQLFLLTTFSSKTQTILVDPSDEGSFNLGNSFESNGWKVLNFDNANGWAIGVIPEVTKAAFASFNWEDPNPSQGISLNDFGKTFHFYRDISLPAGNLVTDLSFKLKMTFGSLFVGVASTDYLPSSTSISVPESEGHHITQIGYSGVWQTYFFNIPETYAGKTIRIIFTCYYAPGSTPGNQTTGPAITEIKVSSRQPQTFNSRPGFYSWNNADAWEPKGIPSKMDDAIVNAGTTFFSGSVSIKNLTVFGTVSYSIRQVAENLVVKQNGLLEAGGLNIGGNFTLEEGSRVVLASSSLKFNRSPELPPLQQVFSFSSVQQFFQGEILDLTMNNRAGLRVKGQSGRLLVGSLNLLAGTLVNDDDVLELKYLNFGQYALINFFDSATWTKPVFRSDGVPIGLGFYGTLATFHEPYLLGSRGEWKAGDDLRAFTIGSNLVHIKCIDDLHIAATAAQNFLLLGILQMAPGKSVNFNSINYSGNTPRNFPGPLTSNLFNNAHVSGGNGVAYRLNGNNLNRVWPIGVDGQQFAVGLYGINASDAIVRISIFRSEAGNTGTGLVSINPLYRYKLEVLEGSLTRVDSINFGYNVMLSGFIQGDQNKRRIAMADSLNGIYNNIGGPTGGLVEVINGPVPFWDFGWINSNFSNFDSSKYFSLGLSEGKFAVMWRNNSMGNFLWDDPSNWSGNVVPTSSDAVIINAPGSTITVSNNSACKLLTLTNGTVLIIPDGVNFKVGG